MATPSSGPISILSIANEFGGAAPHSLSEYYGAAAGVPTSGPISLFQFYGKSRARSYRYYRVEWSDASGTYAGAAEVVTAVGGVKNALSADTRVSSSLYGGGGYEVFDGNPNTEWIAAGSSGEWASMGYYGNVITADEIWVMPQSQANAGHRALRFWGGNGGDIINGNYEVIREYSGLMGGWVIGQWRKFAL